MFFIHLFISLCLVRVVLLIIKSVRWWSRDAHSNMSNGFEWSQNEESTRLRYIIVTDVSDVSVAQPAIEYWWDPAGSEPIIGILVV